jgi:anti-sigma regulatory factor (Ser/Thr protein kinase)
VPDDATVAVCDGASVSQVRTLIRDSAAPLGLPVAVVESLATAAGELARNQLLHARRGRVCVSVVERAGVPGIEVVAQDLGAGIADPAAALRGGAGGPDHLGVGFSAAYRLADEMDVDVRLGEGTAVRLRKFAQPLPRREVAVFGRAFPGEARSGDVAAFCRRGALLTLAVIDGVGHGAAARAPAETAWEAFDANPHRSPREALDACDAALRGTRGAVMSVVQIDAEASTFSHAGVGNVSTHLYSPTQVRRFRNAQRVLGARPGASIPHEVLPLPVRSVVVMFSDGLSTRLDLAADPALMRQPALVIAQRLLERHAQPTDDALVLVAG